MRLCLDSSAWAKRYVAESGTDAVLDLCQTADEILVSVVCVPELVSAFNRLKREGKMSPRQYHELRRRLAEDVKETTVIGLTAPVINRIVSCLERATLKTPDAIHLASAIESMSDLFVTADRQQYRAAVEFHLRAELVI